MTSLGFEIVKSKTTKKWAVTLEVAGDLSFSYNVRPNTPDYVPPDLSFLGGVGIPANKLSDVDNIIALCNKYGYMKAADIWRKKTIYAKTIDYRFGYLTGAKARHYAKNPNAYGEMVKKVRRGER